MALHKLVVVFIAALATAEASKATPIEKVVSLLKGLQSKVEGEGKKEAAAYDKYACFCKEQADEKLYSIEKSNAKIDKLNADIKNLEADIAQYTSQISDLSQKISGLDKEIQKDADDRAADHDKYLAKAKDMNEAIDACAAAIAAIKESKGDLKDAKINLVQVHQRLMATASRQAVGMKSLEKLQKLGQAPAKFTFQSNDIIATLEDLLANFKESKKNTDEDEFNINSTFEKKALGDKNERTFAQKEKDETSALSDDANDRLSDDRESKDQESKDRAADQEFLDTLTAECEAKAKLFDQRSKTRSGELTAMTEAIGHLQEGVVTNEGANKKLVGLVQTPSFIQIRTLQQKGNQAVKRVQALLQEAAGQLDSSVLKDAAVRVQLSADHFVKVRGLIKDLLKRLEDDAKAEAEQKGMCDKQMAAAIKNRDSGQADKEAAHAKITTLTAQKEELKNDIAELAKGIAQNKKELNEATELRNGEKADNEATLASAQEGKESTTLAMNVLADFYKNAFVQTSSKYVPPKSDRDGNTVGDLAPDTFDEEYHGAQGESKGIIGILEVILSDFDRTLKKVAEDEKAQQDAFNDMEKKNQEDTSAKQDTSDKKEAKLKQTEDSILDEQQNHKDATAVFDSGVEKLDDLKAMCVEGAETWAERAAARKKEIEALKDAQNILNEWQG